MATTKLLGVKTLGNLVSELQVKVDELGASSSSPAPSTRTKRVAFGETSAVAASLTRKTTFVENSLETRRQIQKRRLENVNLKYVEEIHAALEKKTLTIEDVPIIVLQTIQFVEKYATTVADLIDCDVSSDLKLQMAMDLISSLNMDDFDTFVELIRNSIEVIVAIQFPKKKVVVAEPKAPVVYVPEPVVVEIPEVTDRKEKKKGLFKK